MKVHVKRTTYMHFRLNCKYDNKTVQDNLNYVTQVCTLIFKQLKVTKFIKKLMTVISTILGTFTEIRDAM